MYEILKKESLNPTVTRMVVSAPEVAAKAEPGQFIILRPLADSERIPLTVFRSPLPISTGKRER